MSFRLLDVGADVFGGCVPSVLGDLWFCGLLGGVFGSGSGKPVGAAGNCSSHFLFLKRIIFHCTIVLDIATGEVRVQSTLQKV